MIVAVSGRGDVSGFFNTQMVLDLNGKCIELIVPRCSLEYSDCASMNYLIMVFCVRDLRGYRRSHKTLYYTILSVSLNITYNVKFTF